MKIALLGSAWSSRDLAPFKDDSWTIWHCSPGTMDIPRGDVFFELHNIDLLLMDGYAEYLEWVKKRPKVYTQQVMPDYPGSIAYPVKEMMAKHGPYFFTSSLSYMFALAMEEKPEAIGVWGVDMSAAEEYGYQRAGCHYFITKCRELGIPLVVPPESDLLEPPPPYGYRESNRMFRKLLIRKKELETRAAALRSARLSKANEEFTITGALDDIEYMINTFPNAVQGDF